MSRRNERKNESGLAERYKLGASTTTTIYRVFLKKVLRKREEKMQEKLKMT